MSPSEPDPTSFAVVDEYFRGWRAHVALWRRRGGAWRPYEGPVPVDALQTSALRHPSPKVRRDCLGVLDHTASDVSTEVFRHALGDPVPRVRLSALHGLSCERCRDHSLCPADVVPDVASLLVGDDSAKVRHQAVLVLARFVDRDDRVGLALLAATRGDADELVRVAAQAALRGDRRRLMSRRALRRTRRRSGDGRQP